MSAVRPAVNSKCRRCGKGWKIPCVCIFKCDSPRCKGS